jgi:hypothetical protein
MTRFFTHYIPLPLRPRYTSLTGFISFTTSQSDGTDFEPPDLLNLNPFNLTTTRPSNIYLNLQRTEPNSS